jgi:mycoredoxin
MTEVNIAKDPRAAARLRGLTGGDETVPTVVVRESCLVNPSVAAVLAALDPP